MGESWRGRDKWVGDGYGCRQWIKGCMEWVGGYIGRSMDGVEGCMGMSVDGWVGGRVDG